MGDAKRKAAAQAQQALAAMQKQATVIHGDPAKTIVACIVHIITGDKKAHQVFLQPGQQQAIISRLLTMQAGTLQIVRPREPSDPPAQTLQPEGQVDAPDAPCSPAKAEGGATVLNFKKLADLIRRKKPVVEPADPGSAPTCPNVCHGD